MGQPGTTTPGSMPPGSMPSASGSVTFSPGMGPVQSQPVLQAPSSAGSVTLPPGAMTAEVMAVQQAPASGSMFLPAGGAPGSPSGSVTQLTLPPGTLIHHNGQVSLGASQATNVTTIQPGSMPQMTVVNQQPTQPMMQQVVVQNSVDTTLPPIIVSAATPSMPTPPVTGQELLVPGSPLSRSWQPIVSPDQNTERTILMDPQRFGSVQRSSSPIYMMESPQEIKVMQEQLALDAGEKQRLTALANDAFAKNRALESEVQRLRSTLQTMSVQDRVVQSVTQYVAPPPSRIISEGSGNLQAGIEQERERNLQMLREENEKLSKQMEILHRKWEQQRRTDEQEFNRQVDAEIKALQQRQDAEVQQLRQVAASEVDNILEQKAIEVAETHHEMKAQLNQAERLLEQKNIEVDQVEQTQAALRMRVDELMQELRNTSERAQEREQEFEKERELMRFAIQQKEDEIHALRVRVQELEGREAEVINQLKGADEYAREAKDRLQESEHRLSLLQEARARESTQRAPNFRGVQEYAWLPRQSNARYGTYVQQMPMQNGSLPSEIPNGPNGKGDTYFWEFLNSSRTSTSAARPPESFRQPNHNVFVPASQQQEMLVEPPAPLEPANEERVLPRPVPSRPPERGSLMNFSLTWGGKPINQQ